ncbi:unnamed protein product [Lactuca virosa]|uniref:Uncharacterized protein n=1 Tax=Lactuca virosa TaxID=75947 RepID=A0AAU9LVU4_9ASTR|nr:unnamed protein product [Lactuca virosa]
MRKKEDIRGLYGDTNAYRCLLKLALPAHPPLAISSPVKLPAGDKSHPTATPDTFDPTAKALRHPIQR